jgi:hypothetical protein
MGQCTLKEFVASTRLVRLTTASQMFIGERRETWVRG